MEPYLTLHKLGFKDVYYRGKIGGEPIYSAYFKGKQCMGTSDTLVFLVSKNKKKSKARLPLGAPNPTKHIEF